MKYTLKFNFSTIKVNRDGSIKGGNGGGECDITTDYQLDELKTKTDDLKSIAYGYLTIHLAINKLIKIQKKNCKTP